MQQLVPGVLDGIPDAVECADEHAVCLPVGLPVLLEEVMHQVSHTTTTTELPPRRRVSTAPRENGYSSYLVGLVVWTRPLGSVQRMTPGSGCWSFQPGACFAW